jgi:LysM repeat protein
MAPRGKHRKPSNAGRNVTRFVLASAVVGTPLAMAAAPAQAATGGSTIWDNVAQCESSGNWSINTGNGFYGGLQFTQSTWQAYGGGSYAPSANMASRDQQIQIAERVLVGQGPGAWPVCSIKAGLTSSNGASVAVNVGSGSGSSSAAPAQQAPAQKAPAPEQKTPAPEQAPAATPQPSTSGGTYTVQSGDTLSAIAARLGVSGGWNSLYQNNQSVVGGNPNLIFPGQVLSY